MSTDSGKKSSVDEKSSSDDDDDSSKRGSKKQNDLEKKKSKESVKSADGKKMSKESVKSGDEKKKSKESDKSAETKKSKESEKTIETKKSKESVKSSDEKKKSKESDKSDDEKKSKDSKGEKKGKSDKKMSKDGEISRRESRDSQDDRKKSKESLDDGKGKGKGKDNEKGKALAEKRGSLKFGDYEEGTDAKGKKGKHGKPVENEKDEFDASKHKKPTLVEFHDKDDLTWGKGVGYKPNDAVPKSGPGVTNEIEKIYGPCALLSEFKYTTWANTVVPLKNHNTVQGFNEMALCLIQLAANGGDNISHEDAYLAVSFLSNVRNDLGEYPPNILALMEHIDYLTKDDASPKYKQMDPCKLSDWY